MGWEGRRGERNGMEEKGKKVTKKFNIMNEK